MSSAKSVERMVKAAQSLIANVETCARESFAVSQETFEADFKHEDPEGYHAWNGMREALKALER